jgi:hypothetical protein
LDEVLDVGQMIRRQDLDHLLGQIRFVGAQTFRVDGVIKLVPPARSIRVSAFG